LNVGAVSIAAPTMAPSANGRWVVASAAMHPAQIHGDTHSQIRWLTRRLSLGATTAPATNHRNPAAKSPRRVAGPADRGSGPPERGGTRNPSRAANDTR
jgi:hypothetical protein